MVGREDFSNQFLWIFFTEIGENLTEKQQAWKGWLATVKYSILHHWDVWQVNMNVTSYCCFNNNSKQKDFFLNSHCLFHIFYTYYNAWGTSNTENSSFHLCSTNDHPTSLCSALEEGGKMFGDVSLVCGEHISHIIFGRSDISCLLKGSIDVPVFGHNCQPGCTLGGLQELKYSLLIPYSTLH